MQTGNSLGVLLAVLTCALGLGAADTRTWKLERQGVTFELTATDLRAWTGAPAGPPAFSVAALLAAEQKRHEGHAKELAAELAGPDARAYPDYTMTQQTTVEVLSVVGTLVSYRQTGGGDTPGTAHPSGYEMLYVRDVTRKDATPSLLDFYGEAQIVKALKADPFIRKFGDPEKGFEEASSLQELAMSLDRDWARENADAEEGDCGFEVSFGDMVRPFYFHHVAKDRVAVRIMLAPANEWCNRIAERSEVGLLLPIPDALREDLLEAARGEAGFLAGNRKAYGSPTWSNSWEVDIRTLVPRKKPWRPR